jgi:hypothetical protein
MNLSRDHCALLLELSCQPHQALHGRVVYRPVGPANIKLYCEALMANRLVFQNVLHGMQQHTVSIEQGLHGSYRMLSLPVQCICLAEATPARLLGQDVEHLGLMLNVVRAMQGSSQHRLHT